MAYGETKVYNDGSHYIAIPHTTRPKRKNKKKIETKKEIELKEIADKVFSENKDKNIALNMLEREKSQTETALENIMRAIEQGIINNMTNKRMKELEEKKQDLDRKLIIEKVKYP